MTYLPLFPDILNFQHLSGTLLPGLYDTFTLEGVSLISPPTAEQADYPHYEQPNRTLSVNGHQQHSYQVLSTSCLAQISIP